MSFASSLILTHLTCKAAIILAVTRIVFYWVPRLRHIGRGLDCIIRYCSSTSSSDEYSTTISPSTTSASQLVTTMAHYSRLHDDDVTTYEEMVADGKLETCKSCAVCLNELTGNDKVRELRNCCHVFHSECIDRWFNHNDQKTCPLCRTSLLLPILSVPLTTCATDGKSEPSWAVERILYLFGDDLL
ncbi:hypothetical protein MKW98_019243 [Papaver atlanticum]|uniref:RING-type domain-containing protein n=1 Tax=Papaver atlanticum TaxID=357466 RepID=A0AAD4XV43_9MAGN|nr:hypothetical protein MKW98_019243 [Papaver atlanticum]